jgi:hypothetical protein
MYERFLIIEETNNRLRFISGSQSSATIDVTSPGCTKNNRNVWRTCASLKTGFGEKDGARFGFLQYAVTILRPSIGFELSAAPSSCPLFDEPATTVHNCLVRVKLLLRFPLRGGKLKPMKQHTEQDKAAILLGYGRRKLRATFTP